MTKVVLHKMRLLATYESGIPLHWQGLKGELLRFIQNASALTATSNRVYCFLFHHPDDELFDDEESNVAVEVTGSKSLSSDEFFIFDTLEEEVTVENVAPDATVAQIKQTVREHYKNYDLEVEYKWAIVFVEEEDKVQMKLYFFN